MRKHVLYIGWVGFGNLGDDICRDLFIANIEEMGANNGLQIDVTSLFPTHFTETNLLRLAPDIVVLGGGSLLQSPYVEPLIFAQKHGIPTLIWGSGIDGMHPPATHVFGDAKATAQQVSHIVRYAGYAGASLLQSVGSCSVGGVRGPDTFAVLQAIGCDLSRVHIAGDPGLLLPSEDASEGEGATRLAQHARPLVGVNWGTTRNRLYGEDEEKTREAFAEALHALSDEYRFVFFAMWGPDLAELKELVERMDRADAVEYVDAVPSQSQLAALLSRCLFTINLKLHANVFSAAVGCPFIALAYRSKGFDFSHSLDYGRFVIPTDAPDLSDAVIARAEQLRDDRDTWAAHIKKHRDRYTARLRQLLHECVRILKE